jgi:hypothetical protein
MSDQPMQNAAGTAQPTATDAAPAGAATDASTGTPPAATGSQAPPAAQPQNGDTAQDSAPGPIPYERFKEVNDKLKALKAEQEKAAAAAAAAQRKQLEEQEKYKELYEAEIAAREAAEAKAAAVQLAQLRNQIATEVGIPPALATRLQGTTAEELKADAAAILEAIPTPTAPNLNAGAGRPTPPSNAPSIDEIKETAARLGINPKYLAKQYNIDLE